MPRGWVKKLQGGSRGVQTLKEDDRERTSKVPTLNPRDGWLGGWPAEGLRAVYDPENGRIAAFLKEQSALLSKSALVLDAGAGRKPYKAIFERFNYQSTDMPGGFYAEAHDFECRLDAIPRPDSSYDVVLLTQVLEHVPDPLKVLRELHRVLAPGGRLLLTVPLNAPLHGEPWHFFHFTHYGIAELAESSGFALAEMEKVGGIFWNLGKRLPDAFRKLFKQYDPFRARKRGQNPFYCVVMNLLLSPLWFFAYLPSAYVLRPLFYWMDFLDLEKSFTLGYTAVLVKPADDKPVYPRTADLTS